MTEPAVHTAPAIERNLLALQLFAQLHGVHIDAKALTHYFGAAGATPDAAGIVAALSDFGLRAQRAGIAGRNSLRKLKQARLPLLLEGRDGDLILLGKIDGEQALVQHAHRDAPERLALAELEKLWNGYVITAERITADAGQGNASLSRFGLHWFIDALQKYRGVMGDVLIASFMVQVFALVTPLVFQVVIDKVLTHRTLTTLDVLAVALVGITVFEVILSGIRHYLFSHTTSRVDVELGAKLFRHLLHLPLAYFESRRVGDTVARVRELENARNFLTGSALTSGLDLLFTVVFLAVMYYYSPLLTFIVLGALPLFFAASFVVTPFLRKRLEDKFALGAENQAFLVETVTAMETLKGQAVERQWSREWERRLADYVKAAFHSGHLANATNQLISLTGKLLTVVLLYVGAKLVIDGNLTVGGLIAFNMLAGRVNAPILRIAQLWQDFQQMRVSVSRLGDILDAPTEPAFKPHRSPLPAIEGRVAFEQVTFRYQPNGPEVLADVSFVTKPGEIVGLVGVSGAGKTTSMRLLQRLYTPERGRVSIDGVDLSLVDTAWLRRQIGVVGQDGLLFNRSVRDNIALANPLLDMEAVIRAAKLAGAHEFILELPEAYDTVIGERGSRLSGGQRARVGIARALATNPRILLLDEATAALDYESERVIHENLAEICKGRTTFIVAHRLSTLKLAHRVLVLERGRLIEQGTHQELIRRPGRYAALYRMHQTLEAQQASASL